MRLCTNRLTLKTLTPRDAALVLDFVVRNHERLGPLEPAREPDYLTLRGQARLLSGDARAWKEQRGVRFWIFANDSPQVIGSIGLYRITYGNIRSAMVGYRLDKDYTGQGYMTEAMGIATKFAFQYLKLHRLEACILPHNEPSIRMAERVGFRREGLLTRVIEVNGKWQDHYLYALINPED